MANDSTSTVVRLAFLSLGVGLLVLALKVAAAWLTGSLALYSDALESTVNIVTAVVALVAVRLAARPADAALPYGYGKVEYFSAVIIGVFIALAAILIFYQAWEGFIAPHDIRPDMIGIAVSVVATAINAGWAMVLVRAGARERSPSLAADGRHLFTDVVSTAAVIIGVLLAIATGYTRLDAILAAFVGVTILWTGWQVVRESVIGLMDVAVDPKRLAQIRDIIAANAEGAIEAHDVRTRQAGRFTFIEFHLVVAGSMSVEAAHAICDRIEAKLRETVGDAQITIHVEPENKAKHSGIVVV
ncbi:MAG: cation-efflux pump [Devosia sp. 67-54]|uniref:cation diffusion facilitator family transporter n=1 Tax=unclassified Devosia TaxID=196773 RepID=UPI00086C93C2|nr:MULTISPECIES: cation diffusion facilitator family transporter [unclassified Devosia]MBN9304552.1 cation transporter [Devosia sp.]ODU55051.1 MAG: cadmium transporter [Acetobacteraceae bacterium SCN 69-10]OJX15452.1 MAG: cation-efflux pump [Devosia sp. 67-54]